MLGDLISSLSNGPYGASYDFLWWLTGDTERTYLHPTKGSLVSVGWYLGCLKGWLEDALLG